MQTASKKSRVVARQQPDNGQHTATSRSLRTDALGRKRSRNPSDAALQVVIMTVTQRIRDPWTMRCSMAVGVRAARCRITARPTDSRSAVMALRDHHLARCPGVRSQKPGYSLAGGTACCPGRIVAPWCNYSSHQPASALTGLVGRAPPKKRRSVCWVDPGVGPGLRGV